VQELTERVRVTPDPSTGLIALRVTAPSSALAVAINRKMLELLNEYNVERRQSRAAQERRFVEERLEEAQAALLDAENDLARFLDQNRAIENSPQLSAELARQSRGVELRQSIYTSLAQSLEQARINEVRTTPVITVIEPPEGWARTNESDPVRASLIAFATGLLVAGTFALVREVLAAMRRENPAEYAEVSELSRSAFARFRSGLRAPR
jgi:uncharacterized protein involved in exopolysaccharide biosynthesis